MPRIEIVPCGRCGRYMEKIQDRYVCDECKSKP